MKDGSGKPKIGGWLRYGFLRKILSYVNRNENQERSFLDELLQSSPVQCRMRNASSFENKSMVGSIDNLTFRRFTLSFSQVEAI